MGVIVYVYVYMSMYRRPKGAGRAAGLDPAGRGRRQARESEVLGLCHTLLKGDTVRTRTVNRSGHLHTYTYCTRMMSGPRRDDAHTPS